jgi:UDP-N-acetylglucosamine/UDP-N-acetylgalactosamine diphosphorylase
VLDPIQLGYTHQQQLHTSLKACTKSNAQEKVGVIGKKNGLYNIVEYSELPPNLAGQLNPNGSLKFSHGHILMFMVRSEFLINLCTGSAAQTNSLYHKAFKKIEHCDPETFDTVTPTEENGWKFELFLHGFLPMVQQGKLGVLMVDRQTEFAPVKEANGPEKTSYGYDADPLPDTPEYAKRMILAEAKNWLSIAEKDGLKIDPETKGKIEVSFYLSYAGENLNWLKMLCKRKPISGGDGYLNHEGEYVAAEQ